MQLSLLNTIINDMSDKDAISDGVSTFGNYRRNLVSLYVNFLDLLEAIYASRGVMEPYWISKKNALGEELQGFMHLGIFKADEKLELGLLVPVGLWKSYETKAKILDRAPAYKNLYESMPNYFYDSIKSK